MSKEITDLIDLVTDNEVLLDKAIIAYLNSYSNTYEYFQCIILLAICIEGKITANIFNINPALLLERIDEKNWSLFFKYPRKKSNSYLPLDEFPQTISASKLLKMYFANTKSYQRYENEVVKLFKLRNLLVHPYPGAKLAFNRIELNVCLSEVFKFVSLINPTIKQHRNWREVTTVSQDARNVLASVINKKILVYRSSLSGVEVEQQEKRLATPLQFEKDAWVVPTETDLVVICPACKNLSMSLVIGEGDFDAWLENQKTRYENFLKCRVCYLELSSQEYTSISLEPKRYEIENKWGERLPVVIDDKVHAELLSINGLNLRQMRYPINQNISNLIVEW